MRYKAIGVPKEDRREMIRGLNPEDFSTDTHRSVSLGVDRSDRIVTIMQSRETKPLSWKVVYGMSQIYFRTFADAMDFCTSRGMEIMKGQMR